MTEALVLGLAQAAALVPGVSRSGAVIAMALFLGLRRDAAARFTFLLGIPADRRGGRARGRSWSLRRGCRPSAAVRFAVGMVCSGVDRLSRR